MATERADNPRSHRDYTIGWVCALAHERAAATAMLDVEHGPLSQGPNDTNSYTLGSIEKHNIVISCLPKGEIGTTAATTVVERMLSTFPSIRFGLMVGIGGGMPPKVRLGDVVVSVPSSHYPGVVQWDMGKAIQGPKAGSESFERTGSLNRPPHILLTAVHNLEAQHERRSSRIPEFLEQLKENSPMMAAWYLRSEALKDVLFHSDYSHQTHSDKSWLWLRLLLQSALSVLNFLFQVFGLFLWKHKLPQPQPQSLTHPQHVQPSQNDSDQLCALAMKSSELEDEEDDGDCRFCDPTEIIKRKPPARAMRIHYGLVLSGNQVIKDAVFRDKLNAKHGGGVLCIEMEAAGLMNNFPCLVIRGICDYADSHKNKRWQRHAAAVAAAYAKELLQVVRPVDVNGERAALEVIQEVKQKVVETAENVNYLKRGLQRREDLDVLDWLTPINFGSQHSLYRDKQQRGTGTWFLNSAEYQSWRDEDRKVLFCQGIPGAGKTILSSIVIEDLANVSHSLAGKTEAAYIYCDYRRQDEQTALGLLSSLTKQLCLSKESLSPGVGALHAKHTSKSTRPSLQEVTRALEDVIQRFTRVYVVIDALDELLDDDDHRNAFVDGLRNLGQSSPNLRLFVTSRPLLADISQFFYDAAKVEISANQDDLGKYVDGRFSTMPVSSPLRTNEVLQQEVKDTISQVARGMFLLAQLYMDSLRDKCTAKEVRDVLRGMQHQNNTSNKLSVEERLYKAYGETLARIDKQELGFRDRAMQILLWITHAKRPLLTDELRHALAVEVGHNDLDEDNIMANLDVSICAGLAIVDNKSQEVRLVHYTTQEYLEQRHFKQTLNMNPHATITDVCVTYLMFSVFKSGPCSHNDKYVERTSTYPLYFYAAAYWAHHARLSSESSELLLRFLQCKEATGAAAQADDVQSFGSGVERWNDYYGKDFCKQSALHLAVKYGLHTAAEALPEGIEDLDALYDHKTPLYVALEGGDMTMARILLRKGAQVCVLGGFPVLKAFCNERYDTTEVDVSMVEDLLNRGAEIGDANGDCQLLVHAAGYGREQLVSLLLRRGTKVESLGHFSWDYKYEKVTPLFAAAAGGHVKTAMSLWKSGANPNWRVWRVWRDWAESVKREWHSRQLSAFHVAVEGGHERLVKAFLGKEDGMGLISHANSSLDDSSVKFLDHGPQAENQGFAKECIPILAKIAVDIELQDSDGYTPLALAAKSGHRRIAELLLCCGADIEAKNHEGDTPLLVAVKARKSHMVEMAVEGRKSRMVELLLQNGANTEATDRNGRTPLLAAAEKGDAHLVELLHGYTPLFAAVYRGNAHLVELLVHKGADTLARNVFGDTLLIPAVAGGHYDTADIWLQKGLEINAVNELGETALFSAVFYGHASLVKLLLNNGATIEPQDKHGLLKPLAWAELLGEADVARVLIEHFPDIRSREDDGETLLCLAARGTDEYWAGEVLQKGAQRRKRNKWGETPLDVALDSGNPTMVSTLCIGGDDVKQLETNSQGLNPLEYAMSKGSVRV